MNEFAAIPENQWKHNASIQSKNDISVYFNFAIEAKFRFS